MVETLRPKFGQDFEAKFSLTRSMTLKQLLGQYFFNFSQEDISCLSENDKYDQAQLVELSRQNYFLIIHMLSFL